VDLDRGQRRVLGRIPGFFDHCQTTERYIACGSEASTFRIWRLVG
jgi:hypothetical protein